jgi:glycosyl transferase family 25
MRPLPQVMTYVINLDRSPQRLAAMTERLAPLPLTWQRISAVEGKHLNLPKLQALSIPQFLANHGKQPKPAEVGCYLSHLKVFEAFLATPESEAEFALILEDDVKFAPDFMDVLSGLIHHRADWDLVRLSGFHSGGPVGIRELCPGRRLAIMFFKQTSSAAYIINRHAARQMLERLVPMTVPYDHAYDQPWALNLKARMVSPLPIELDWAQESTIGYAPADSGKLPWYQRWSTYRYRLTNELRRGAYSLLDWWQHRHPPH